MIKNQTYKTSKYSTFLKNDNGKQRVIYKLPFFPDRVCHWAIIQVVEPYFLNKLNHCTHSAIPKRGIHSALKQLDSFMNTSNIDNFVNSKYCLKVDVRKFYPTISHDILKTMYRTIFKDQNLLWLIDEIIESSPPMEISEVDKNLQIFGLDLDDIGVPIGNYLSQYSGNLYLYQFDRWIKETLRVERYSRYMDDMVFLHKDKSYLHELKYQAEDYLNNNLNLLLKDDYQVFPSRVRGVDFVGYRHFGGYILLRKSISKKLTRSMRDIMAKIDKGLPFTHADYCSINSYKGWLKWCNGHNLYSKWIQPLECYAKEYYIREIKQNTNNNYGGIIIEKI